MHVTTTPKNRPLPLNNSKSETEWPSGCGNESKELYIQSHQLIFVKKDDIRKLQYLKGNS